MECYQDGDHEAGHLEDPFEYGTPAAASTLPDCVKVTTTQIINREGQVVSEETVMENLFNTFAKPGMVEEANRFRTVKRGSYTIQPTKVEGKLTKQDENDPSKVQRPYLHVQASVLNEEGKRQATVFFNASWEEGRTKTGRLDGMSKLWGNIEKAYNSVGKSVGEIKDVLTKFPCRAYIDVVYKDQAGGRFYIDSKNGIPEADQEKNFLTQGYAPENTVLNIMPSA